MGDYELAFRAVAASLTQSEKAESINMNEQGKFPHVGELAAPGALAPPRFGVLVQGKTIPWRQLPQLFLRHEVNPFEEGSFHQGDIKTLQLCHAFQPNRNRPARLLIDS